MPITTGDTLPNEPLFRLGADGIEEVRLGDASSGKKVAVFGMPGAFTGTCTAMHMPSIVATADELRAKGVDDIVVTVVNDLQVAKAWAEATGATDAGVTVLADPSGAYAKAIGHTFDVPAMGFFGRQTRHMMTVEDGTVTAMVLEENSGVCDMTNGKALLDMI